MCRELSSGGEAWPASSPSPPAGGSDSAPLNARAQLEQRAACDARIRSSLHVQRNKNRQCETTALPWRLTVPGLGRPGAWIRTLLRTLRHSSQNCHSVRRIHHSHPAPPFPSPRVKTGEGRGSLYHSAPRVARAGHSRDLSHSINLPRISSPGRDEEAALQSCGTTCKCCSVRPSFKPFVFRRAAPFSSHAAQDRFSSSRHHPNLNTPTACTRAALPHVAAQAPPLCPFHPFSLGSDCTRLLSALAPLPTACLSQKHPRQLSWPFRLRLRALFRKTRGWDKLCSFALH